MRVFVRAREGGEGGERESERERFVGLQAGISYFPKRVAVLRGE
jgi:hypothetical protein